MLNHDIVLKNNELLLVGNEDPGTDDAGLYTRDTRFLRTLLLSVNDKPLRRLDARSENVDHAHYTYVLDPTSSHQVAIEAELSVGRSLTLDLRVLAFGTDPWNGTLTLDVSSDYVDVFYIRGLTGITTPTIQAPRISEDRAVLGASSPWSTFATNVTWDPAPSVSPVTLDGDPGVRLAWQVDFARGEDQHITVEITPDPPGDPLRTRDQAGVDGEFTSRLRVDSNHHGLAASIQRADEDLALLQTTFPHGAFPAAGVPWYVCPFGRDSLITALQTQMFYPHRSSATLRALAELQGTGVDAFREEQPGKIVHEVRYGDLARSGQIPHTRYYGSIDATPLFVMTAARHWLWHRDDALLDTLLPHIWRAFEWMETYGNLDRQGYITYSGVAADAAHISQQGWKDSGDSLHFADGRDVTGPIALVEVQGYAYAAYAWLADVLELRGETDRIDELRAKAERIRRAIERDFWMDNAGCYAQALDGEGRQVDSVSSNGGHLLFCGVPSPERAARVAERFGQPDMNDGWGLRTLSRRMATFNPMSYHNGSIWPHDMSITMAGLAAYGCHDEAATLAFQLAKLAETVSTCRLSELYCGFSGERYPEGPVEYPVSCSPQAWAAGAAILAAVTLLGIHRGDDGALATDPHLPGDLDLHLEVANEAVAIAAGD